MQFIVSSTPRQEETIFASEMSQGDIALLTSGVYKGLYIVCTYGRRVTPNIPVKAWTILNDPQLHWQGFILDMTVRLVQLGETISLKRNF